jgi:uncharacterized protein with beta-barrel porin domain
MMNNKPLPSRFSVKPLALLIPIASVSLALAPSLARAAENIEVEYSNLVLGSVNIFNNVVTKATVTSTGSIVNSYGSALRVGGTANIFDGIFNEVDGFISGSEPNYMDGLAIANFSGSGSGSGSYSGSYSGSGNGISVSGPSASVGVITNSGTISNESGGDAILIENGATTGTISNLAGGEINGAIAITSGAQVNGSIINAGNLSGGAFYGAAIIVEDGGQVTESIINSAPINTVEIVHGSVGNLDNSGGISGGVAIMNFSSDGFQESSGEAPINSSLGSLTNSGNIGVVFVADGAEITGELENNNFIGVVDVYNDASIGSISNSGVISGGINFEGNAQLKGNLTNSASGQIDGVAFVEGSSFTGDIINEGAIFDGFTDGYGYVDIAGAIEINGDSENNQNNQMVEVTQITGLELDPNEPITIDGKIFNTATGSIVNLAEATTVDGGELIPFPNGPQITKPNAGVIDQTAIYLNYVNMTDGIYNEGLISSENGTGIRLENASVDIISNEKNATIEGGNGYAIFIDDTASVNQIVNSGTISGMVDFGVNGGLYKTIGGVSDEIINASELHLGAATSGALGALVSQINGSLIFSGDISVDANGSTAGVRYGQLEVSQDATLNGSLFVNVTGETFFSNDEVLELIKTGGTLTTDIDSAETNSLLLDFTPSKDASSLFVTVERNEVADVVEDIITLVPEFEEPDIDSGSGGAVETLGIDSGSAGAVNVVAVAVALDQVAALIETGEVSEDSELGKIFASLQGEDDPVELVRAIKSLQPEAGGGSVEGSVAAAGAVSTVIANRQEDLRNSFYSLYETGMVAGDDIAITGFWIQGYDKDTEQDLREAVDGYDLDMYGLAIGADAPINDRTTVGVAISYADSQVDSKGIEGNEMSIDSYQISSYVSFNEDDYYLDALVSYARNEYDGLRNLTTGLTSTSDYAGDQIGLRARGGYPFVLESGLHITPNTAVEYSYLKEEGYTEEGAGNASNQVDSQSLEALVWAAGVSFSYPFTTQSDVTWMPDFHIEVRHDFIADEVELDTNFVGVGGAGFSTNGASIERTAYKAGVGLRAWSQSSLSFMFRYDYTYKEDYKSQAVAATMRYSF